MLQQETLVKAVCDYCRTVATVPRDNGDGDGDVTSLFADEAEARALLGLDDADPQAWRELDNSLLLCPACARARDCVLGGGHFFDDWAACRCGGWWWEKHQQTEAGDECAYEIRTCPRCHTTQHRRRTDTNIVAAASVSRSHTAVLGGEVR